MLSTSAFTQKQPIRMTLSTKKSLFLSLYVLVKNHRFCNGFEEHLKKSFLDVFSNVTFCNAEKIGNIITHVQNLKSIRAPSTAGKESLCCGFG